MALAYPLLLHRSILRNLLVAARRKSVSAREVPHKAMAMQKQFGVVDGAQHLPILSARIQSAINLISRSATWHSDIESCLEFFELDKERKRRFVVL